MLMAMRSKAKFINGSMVDGYPFEDKPRVMTYNYSFGATLFWIPSGSSLPISLVGEANFRRCAG